MPTEKNIQVTSEIGTLKRLLIHSPDGGIGKVVPSKFKEWLYDDTVHLAQMRFEYNQYIKLLLYFLDPEKIAYIKAFENGDTRDKQLDCFKPGSEHYFNSDNVLDTQFLLAKILKNEAVKQKIVTAVCAIEGTSYKTEKQLLDMQDVHQLANVLISGVLSVKQETTGKYIQFIFPPLPNFIFTRDISIVLNDHILLSKAATEARERESLLIRFIAYYELFKDDHDKVIEVNNQSDFFLLSEEQQQHKRVSVEGGDVMMIAPKHMLIGCSERTTVSAVNEMIHNIFSHPGTGIEKISVVKIPQQRAMMHIDTVFTHVRKDVWVMYGKFSEQVMYVKNEHRFSYYKDIVEGESSNAIERVEVLRFYKPLKERYNPSTNYQQDVSYTIKGLETLLRDISINDFGVPQSDVKIIYSGNNVFPYDDREQWTDSCNLLALKDGVVVGYDRNEETVKGFIQNGFRVVKAQDLFTEFENGTLTPGSVENTLILLPSAELSRARGGAHCMSMPLLRTNI